MESAGLRLRSGGGVPAQKSPTKESNGVTDKDNAKSKKKGRGGGGKPTKKLNIGDVMMQAQTYFEEEGIEGGLTKKRGKRGRGKEDEEEKLEEKILAETEVLAAKVAKVDPYLFELDSRRAKAMDDISRYKEKATLAKTLLKGPESTKKGVEIKNKLKHLNKLLLVLQELNAKRTDAIYAAALEEVSAASHTAKKRCTGASTMSEDSEGDDLDVSEGERPFPRFLRILHSSPLAWRSPQAGRSPHTF